MSDYRKMSRKVEVVKTPVVVTKNDYHIGKLPEEQDEDKRIQIRLSADNYKFLESEAKRTGNTLSSLASLIVADGLLERQIKINKADVVELVQKDSEFRKQLKEYLDSMK